MPKVKLSPTYKTERIENAIFAKIRRLNVKGKDLAELWGCTPQNANKRIKTMQMDWKAFIKLMHFLEFSDDEMMEVFK